MAAVGSITFDGPTTTPSDKSVQKYTFAWISSAGGAVSGIPSPYPIRGIIWRVVFAPGSPAPTDAYDVTMTDAYGIDILGGLGANLSTSTPSHGCPSSLSSSLSPIAVADVLTLVVANAGNAKQGTVAIYVTK